MEDNIKELFDKRGIKTFLQALSFLLTYGFPSEEALSIALKHHKGENLFDDVVQYAERGKIRRDEGKVDGITITTTRLIFYTPKLGSHNIIYHDYLVKSGKQLLKIDKYTQYVIDLTDSDIVSFIDWKFKLEKGAQIRYKVFPMEYDCTEGEDVAEDYVIEVAAEVDCTFCGFDAQAIIGAIDEGVAAEYGEEMPEPEIQEVATEPRGYGDWDMDRATPPEPENATLDEPMYKSSDLNTTGSVIYGDTGVTFTNGPTGEIMVDSEDKCCYDEDGDEYEDCSEEDYDNDSIYETENENTDTESGLARAMKAVFGEFKNNII